MKVRIILPILICAVVMQLQPTQAQDFSLKTSKFLVAGTSSLHDWESSVEAIDIKGVYVISNETLADVRGVVVKIPVKAIKSTKGKLMNNKTWEAFNYEKHPFIAFTLSGNTIPPGKNIIEATGSLSMAGVTRTIDLSLTYKILPGGDLMITGTKKLKMTDFKMEPPTAMMGTVKVGDEVEVRFELVLSPEKNTL